MDDWSRYGRPYGFRVSPGLWEYIDKAAEAQRLNPNRYLRYLVEVHARRLRRKESKTTENNGPR